MTYSVKDYRLPEGAGALDRWTLRTWKVWAMWIRPIGAAALLMILGHLATGWAIVAGTQDPAANPLRYVVRWSAQPRPPLISPSPVLGVVHGPGLLWESIAVQFAAVIVGTLLALIVIRRHPRPVLLGVLAGLLAAAAHVTIAGLWTLHPLGAIGPKGIGVTVPASIRSVHVYVGSTVQSALGVIGLWSPALFGGIAGWIVDRGPARRAGPRRSSSPTA